jgi:AcrR family transcriptional regulator
MRDRIVAEAAALFRDRGYTATTTRDIARAVGLTQGTLYWHFPSKQAILQAYLTDSLQTFTDIVTGSLTSEAPNGQLREFVQAYVSAQLKHLQSAQTWATLHSLQHLQRYLPDEDAMRLRDLQHHVMDLLKEILARGQADGSFAPTDLTPTAYAIMTMCEYVVTWWKSEGRLDVDAIATLYGELALRMVRP